MKDLAGRKYWDNLWANIKLQGEVNPEKSYTDRCYHNLFIKYLPKGRLKALEVGCGGSAWLPYFAKEFGYEIYGIDYAPKGIELEKKILQEQGVSATLICGDFLKFSFEKEVKFDIILSLGLLEHYTQPIVLLNKMKDLLKPNGLIVTTVPNFSNKFIKFLHFIVSKKLFKVHSVITPEDLNLWQKQIGLERVVSARYFGFLSFYSRVNLDFVLDKMPKIFHYTFLQVIRGIDRVLELFPRLFDKAFDTRLFSRNIVSIYRKPPHT